MALKLIRKFRGTTRAQIRRCKDVIARMQAHDIRQPNNKVFDNIEKPGIVQAAEVIRLWMEIQLAAQQVKGF